MDRSYGALQSQNINLIQENANLRLMAKIVKENHDLRSRLFTTGRTSEEHRGRRGKVSLQWQETLDEGTLKDEFSFKPLKTSSPLPLDSLAKENHHEEESSNAYDAAPAQSSMASPTQDKDHSALLFDVKDLTSKNPDRLLGEVVFQLDRRILSYVFPRQFRLYGFTVLNIRDKITQVSTNPQTGKVDEEYHCQLTKRHHDLMENLQCLGYCVRVHPTLTEDIINTYGILKQRPDTDAMQELGYNNPDFLRKMIINIAPSKMLKDLLILLRCLCFMARQDGKPLFLW